MSKTLKKLLVAIVIFIAICLLKNVNSFAYVLNEDEAYNNFSKVKNNSTYNLYIGETMYSTIDWSASWYLKPKIEITDKSIVKVVNSDSLKAIKKGSTTVKVTVQIEGKSKITKTFKINVKETSESTKLESNINDVVNISQDLDAKTKVLLANSELWNTKSKTYKINKKETGNVAKFVYASVYENQGDVVDEYRISQTLKKDGKLTIKNSKKTKKVSNVKDIYEWGYLTKDGKFYFLNLDKNGKFQTELRLKGVSKIINKYLVIKDGKTYAISGKKIFNFAITSCNPESSCSIGLGLTSKGVLYYYKYDYTKDKYETKKVEEKVASVSSNWKYTTKSGKTKKYDTGWNTEDNKYTKTLWLANGNTLGLKSNGNAYLNDTKILNKVEEIYSVEATNSTTSSALLVRKDGSIWRLDVGAGNSKLTKIRSGDTSKKKISKPTNLKVKQSGKTTAKITWSKVEGATKYTVYRATSKNGKYKKIGTSKTTSYKDKNLKKGKKYYYKVVANASDSTYDSAKTSAKSVKISK